jgi:hypothetical protein
MEEKIMTKTELKEVTNTYCDYEGCDKYAFGKSYLYKDWCETHHRIMVQKEHEKKGHNWKYYFYNDSGKGQWPSYLYRKCPGCSLLSGIKTEETSGFRNEFTTEDLWKILWEHPEIREMIDALFD